MKQYLITIITICTLASCSKWLDVTPASEVSKDALFSTEDGFKEAVNGMYGRLTKEDLFGRELTAGTLDALAQNYTVDVNDPWRYRPTMQYNYQDQYFMSRRDEIWKGLYNVVANANLILENVDAKKNLFKGVNYELVKGEALAMRAYCHFDLLRLFAGSYAVDKSGKGIPYTTSFSNKTPEMKKVEEALDLVIKDLLDAKELLRATDPIRSPGYKVGYPEGDTTTEADAPDLFLQERRHRLNYYAVCGELARAYLYKGDKDAALGNALEVIGSAKFPFTKATDFLNPDDEKKDRILYKELIFGIYAPNANQTLRDVIDNGIAALYLQPAECRSIYEVGGVGAEDYRYKQWFEERSSAAGSYLRVMKYTRDGDRNLHNLMLPAMRLSEMYYIAAECTFDKNPAEAWGYFNTVRLNRGIGVSLSDPSRTVFMNELLKEARKEFFSEGQLFYMYKRLNANIAGPQGSVISAGNAVFVLPFPDDEIAYGNR
ncbi:RagB/SusD family nutrient uptake outer membrane protein [Chitinophaga sp. GCM10012297]|uniref:RagB/SusD family nutrient uptake outer membrane protein n=1 Tax=Chitinophaga chungangae TaxID=2821488 RepID=A0ABS3YFY6_9BACT|nr:RagB/SusD family nutrient uptake outer membrane protein [Chitinophaga chungangae]MBO9153576.1 RagB/SusD family nutrient uptake outer membrane protein [Chitinophaga chungangae]